MTDRDKPTEEDRPLWSMSRDEQRLLWITFVGGLASILVGAGIIGAAIVFARYEVRQNSVTWLAVVTLATPVAVVL
jgi:hypothetical protein